MKYLVTGATGKLGQKVVKALLKSLSPSDLAVSVRDPKKAEDLKNLGVDVRHGDFDEPEALVETFSGINRLLIISTDGDNETRIRQHKNAVDAASKAGVDFIAYTSVGNAQESDLFLAVVHKTTEDAIKATGINYAFLRNNWYLENEASSIAGALAGGPWITSAGNGKVGWAPQQDYAEAAANVLLDTSVTNATYELSGPLLTQHELVDAVGKVIGKNITLNDVDDNTYGETMASVGVPDFIVPMLVSIQKDIREGTLEVVSDDFEKLLGRPVTPLEDALKTIIENL